MRERVRPRAPRSHAFAHRRRARSVDGAAGQRSELSDGQKGERLACTLASMRTEHVTRCAYQQLACIEMLRAGRFVGWRCRTGFN